MAKRPCKIKITLYGSINNIRYAVQVDYYDIDDSDYKEFDSWASAMQEYDEIKGRIKTWKK